jgi:asparagine synthase (glutamine-hydrolysing)
MCGVCGYSSFGGPPPSRSVAESMALSIAHRGPDDWGVYADESVALAHRRLSIIDLSSAGRQPMELPDRGLVLTYNGEIYNFRELRSELEAGGSVFRSRTDSEVILHAFARWGADSFSRLNGMFAFAIWDARERALWLVRDRFGIKPLFYARHDKGLAFASEIKALLQWRPDLRRPDPVGLHEYLWYGNALGTRTTFEGIREVEPGHYLRRTPDGESQGAYWTIETVPAVDAPLSEVRTEVRERLRRAVRSQLVADVPVGVMLSGGIDSSAITAFAAEALPSLGTYSVAFDFAAGESELPKARKVAEHFGTDHHELFVTSGDAGGIIEQLVDAHDEPFGDAANIPLFLVSREIRGEIKVVLQGDGGDEIFAGYTRHALMSRIPDYPLLARLTLAATSPLPRTRPVERVRRLLRVMAEPTLGRRMALYLTMESPLDPPTSILTKEARASIESSDPFARYVECATRFAGRSDLQTMRYTDCAVILPDTFLDKVDRSTMANGLEVRVPFLDAEIADYALGLPADLVARNGTTKWILKSALRGVVPDFVLDGPKVGFGVPYAEWLATTLGGYLEEVFSDPVVRQWGFFDTAAVLRRAKAHREGRGRYGFLLWKALNAALWYRRRIAA